MSEFKVGDKVRVVKSFSSEKYPQIGYYEFEMDKFVGQEGVVIDYSTYSGGYNVHFDGGNYLWWPAESLEILSDKLVDVVATEVVAPAEQKRLLVIDYAGIGITLDPSTPFSRKFAEVVLKEIYDAHDAQVY